MTSLLLVLLLEFLTHPEIHERFLSHEIFQDMIFVCVCVGGEEANRAPHLSHIGMSSSNPKHALSVHEFHAWSPNDSFKTSSLPT
jgi:hypothetical protein